MRTNGRAFVQLENRTQEPLRRVEVGQGVHEDRHVAMYAPFAAVGTLDVGEGGGEVEVAQQFSIGTAFDHLVQIDALVEALKLRQGFRVDAWHPQGGRELQLENANARAFKARDAAGRVLEL